MWKYSDVDVTVYLESWRNTLAGNKSQETKTQWMECRFAQAERVDRQTVKTSGEELKKVNNIKYLVAGVERERRGGMDMQIRQSDCSIDKLAQVMWRVV